MDWSLAFFTDIAANKFAEHHRITLLVKFKLRINSV